MVPPKLKPISLLGMGGYGLRTMVFEIKLDAGQRNLLTDMCHCAKNLYNSGLYIVRQTYHETKKHTTHQTLDKKMREENKKIYYKLNSVATQGVLKRIGEAYKSYFELIKAFKKTGGDSVPRPPKYLKNKGLSTISLNPRSFSMEDDQISISVSKYHRNRHNISKIILPFNIPDGIGEVRLIDIVPIGNCRFELHVKYKEKEVKIEDSRTKDGFASIDLGLNNLVTMVSGVDGKSLLVSGKQLKSVNAYWNKRAADLRSKISKAKGWDKLNLKRELKNITIRRNRTVKDTLHKISFNIIKYALDNGISTIIVGKNKGWKTEINIGKRNNQNFVNIPHAKLIDYLTYKGEKFGIKVEGQEESYTSKCDSLAFEEIRKHEKYMGRRKKRGLFKSATGKAVNADVKGALNIMRKWNSKNSKKSNDESFVRTIIGKGHVFCPSKTAWGFNPYVGSKPRPSGRGN
jgi:putative transposase